jgi:hypothetical protein
MKQYTLSFLIFIMTGHLMDTLRRVGTVSSALVGCQLGEQGHSNFLQQLCGPS